MFPEFMGLLNVDTKAPIAALLTLVLPRPLSLFRCDCGWAWADGGGDGDHAAGLRGHHPQRLLLHRLGLRRRPDLHAPLDPTQTHSRPPGGHPSSSLLFSSGNADETLCSQFPLVIHIVNFLVCIALVILPIYQVQFFS